MAKQQNRRLKRRSRQLSNKSDGRQPSKRKINSRDKTSRYRKSQKLKDPTAGAKQSLRNFRQATILAVAITGFIMLFFDPDAEAQNVGDSTVLDTEAAIQEDLAVAEAQDSVALEVADPTEAASEAVGAVQEMFRGFYYNLPKILVATAILLIVWLLVKGINTLIRKMSGRWERTEAITTLVGIVFWILGIGIAISILAEDVRALIGSLGLVGLALSWALQSPIESFTGWLLNKFKGYYRIGDRVIVGDVIGDVYKIDFLNTTLWEIGDPFSPGFVGAEQPTGRLVTFPNNEIVNGVIINFTGDFPYVWDELAVPVANESDLPYAITTIEKVASAIFDPIMKEPAEQYEKILRRAKLEENIPDKPQLFLSAQDSWTNIIVRYLVHARERRKWKTELLLKVSNELKKPEHVGKIVTAYPRNQMQFIDQNGIPSKKADGI